MSNGQGEKKKKAPDPNERIAQFRKMQAGEIDEISFQGKSFPRGKGDYSGLEKKLVSDSIAAAGKSQKKKK